MQRLSGQVQGRAQIGALPLSPTARPLVVRVLAVGYLHIYIYTYIRVYIYTGARHGRCKMHVPAHETVLAVLEVLHVRTHIPHIHLLAKGGTCMYMHIGARQGRPIPGGAGVWLQRYAGVGFPHMLISRAWLCENSVRCSAMLLGSKRGPTPKIPAATTTLTHRPTLTRTLAPITACALALSHRPPPPPSRSSNRSP